MYSATIMWEMVDSSRIQGDSAGFFAFIIIIIAAVYRVLGNGADHVTDHALIMFAIIH